ncbi:MAG: response regulator [Hydrogenovibrio sp.]|uniref:ATP-binding response regulator n=1 Tax=Hydrogenovibrio sp. TaxID=2065821 RepID=UPI00286FB19A|nr:response regulator [Hydrogenovibrio sp.]MDR9500026.1 response regulator [Hydrogenovibrio sp.]
MSDTALHRLLLVDDHPQALKLLSRLAEKLGYSYETATDGREALQKVSDRQPGYFSAVITDRMMPNLGGIGLLESLHQLPGYEHLPVIMQTALSDEQSVQEGIEAGAFYYLSKPLNLKVVEQVIAAAVVDFKTHQALLDRLNRLEDAFSLLYEARFQYRTLEEASHLAAVVSRFTRYPTSSVIALYELMVNAVEHGNLGIQYEEKTRLIQSETLQGEIQKRLQTAPYAQRYVTVAVVREEEGVKVVVSDMGEGFDCEPFMSFSPERMMDTHGRGILMASTLGETRLAYSDGGRTVTCHFEQATTKAQTDDQ